MGNVRLSRLTITHCVFNASTKQKALSRLDAPALSMLQVRAPDSLMRFMQTL